MRMPVHPAWLAPASNMNQSFWFMLPSIDSMWSATPPVPAISTNRGCHVQPPSFCTAESLTSLMPFLVPSTSMFSNTDRHGIARFMPQPVFVCVNPPLMRMLRMLESQNDSVSPLVTDVDTMPEPDPEMTMPIFSRWNCAQSPIAMPLVFVAGRSMVTCSPQPAKVTVCGLTSSTVPLMTTGEA